VDQHAITVRGSDGTASADASGIMRNLIWSSVLASTLLVGCAVEDPGTDLVDPSDPSDPQDPDEPTPGCTADNDVVPMAEIAATFGDRLDAVRAIDDTLYFITKGDGSTANATIGRRERCRAIEADWMEVSAPITTLEIGSDNVLYMAGFEDAARANTSARLIALDLADPAALPFSLLNAPGEQIRGLRADDDGRVYWVQGWDDNQVRYLEGGNIRDLAAISSSTYGRVLSVSPAADGFVWSSEKGTGGYVGTLAPSFSGAPMIRAQATSEKFHEVVADANGGFYAVSTTGTGSTTQWMLVHRDSVTATPTLVDSVGGPLHGRYAFGSTDDATTTMRLTSGGLEASAAVVSLTTPLMH
jgi:hypothetical protein